MDPLRNPYRPGAGQPPPVLVGRDREIEDFDIAIQRLERGAGDRSQLLYGLRGVGKTVLLREFTRIAEKRNWPVRSVEAGSHLDFPGEIAGFARVALARLSAMKKLHYIVRRGLSVLKSFQLRYRLPEGPEILAGVEPSIGGRTSGTCSRTPAISSSPWAARRERRESGSCSPWTSFSSFRGRKWKR